MCAVAPPLEAAMAASRMRASCNERTLFHPDAGPDARAACIHPSPCAVIGASGSLAAAGFTSMSAANALLPLLPLLPKLKPNPGSTVRLRLAEG